MLQITKQIEWPELRMSDNDNNLEYVYNEVLIVMERLLKEDQNPLAIAAVLASQAMGLYKTILSDKDYETMINSLADKKDNVQPYEARSLH
jgi:DNA polymerase III delta subunit